jgi:hypothetical protein
MKSNADACQDIFTFDIFGRKTDGYFLDIGCSNGKDKNNSLLLEENGWTGLLFDIGESQTNEARACRKGKVFTGDCSAEGYLKKILDEENVPKVIDYISLDIDHASLICLQNFPLREYRFKFMTFEHDIYAGRDECIARKIVAPELLKSFNYVKIADNVQYMHGFAFEDWYVDPTYFDMGMFKNFIDKSDLHFMDIYSSLNL